MPIASDSVNPRRQGDDFIVTGSGVRFPRLTRPTPRDSALRARPDSRRAACMPRGQRPFRRVAIASWIAAVLLGVTIQGGARGHRAALGSFDGDRPGHGRAAIRAAAAPADPVRLVARPWLRLPGPLRRADGRRRHGRPARRGVGQYGHDRRRHRGADERLDALYGLGHDRAERRSVHRRSLRPPSHRGWRPPGRSSTSIARPAQRRSVQLGASGVFLRVSVDVFRFDGDTGAVFLFAKGSADTVGGALYGVACGAGVRF